MGHLATKPDGINKILFVEDDTQLQQVYQLALKKEGYDVTVMDSHEDLDTEIQAGDVDLEDFDLMLSDNTTIGDMAGADFAIKYGHQVPVLMCSSEISAIQKAANHSVGGILKPVTMQQLTAKVNEVANELVAPTKGRAIN